jgi:thiamine-monophosphate kinase
MKSEREFLDRLREKADRPVQGLRLGIGDDAAAIEPTPNHLLVAASDLLIEGVHFRTSYFSPFYIGFKALAVNLSDMAAMGATPRWCLMNLALPGVLSDNFADEIVRGVVETGETYGVRLIGGDTSKSPGPLFIDVTMLGEARPDRILTRAGARPGDAIFVSGNLGDAAVGLSRLERGVTPTQPDDCAIRRHLAPVPRLALGSFLASVGFCTAALDLSDGLSLDLARLCAASKVGANVFQEKIPVSTEVHTEAATTGRPISDFSLNGGEDFELLFTIRPEAIQVVEKTSGSPDIGGVCLSHIGFINEHHGEITIQDRNGRHPLAAKGFDHFTRSPAD